MTAMGEILLSEMEVGQRAVIVSGPTLRMMEMGMLVGTPVELAHLAPFGGAIAVKCRSTTIAFRIEDAAQIKVRLVK